MEDDPAPGTPASHPGCSPSCRCLSSRPCGPAASAAGAMQGKGLLACLLPCGGSERLFWKSGLAVKPQRRNRVPGPRPPPLCREGALPHRPCSVFLSNRQSLRRLSNPGLLRITAQLHPVLPFYSRFSQRCKSAIRTMSLQVGRGWRSTQARLAETQVSCLLSHSSPRREMTPVLGIFHGVRRGKE